MLTSDTRGRVTCSPARLRIAVSSASLPLLLALAVSLLLGVFVPRAGAVVTSQYGQVQRFGGFDLGAEQEKPLEAGKFLDPRGFAVDAQDSTGGAGNTAVYVLDRTSIADSGKCCESMTGWRIQKLTEKGEVLGTTTFTLPNKPLTAVAVEGLAVDHAAGRLYALIVGQPPKGAKKQPVAQELIAWSTAPNVSKELVAVSGLPADPLGTKAGLLSSRLQLQPPGAPLYLPQGIAIDSEGGANPSLAIEATNLLAESAGVPAGAAIVRRVATGATETGALLPGEWSSESVASQLGGSSWGPAGISRNPDGSLTALLDNNIGGQPLYAVNLNASLGSSSILDSETSLPGSLDFDERPFGGNLSPFGGGLEQSVSDAVGAGPELVRLSTPGSSTTGGLYAGMFVGQGGGTPDPQIAEAPYYFRWGLNTKESESALYYQANIGVRLLQQTELGLISDPLGNTIVNTLGNPVLEGPCDIGSARTVALAAGGKGALWILVQGPGSERLQEPTAGPGINPANTATGDQVIEMAPGAGTECPQPSGTFTMQPAGGSSQPGNSELTIPVGTTVKFDAGGIERQGGVPFAYAWQLNSKDATRGMPVNEMQAPNFIAPPATAEYTYLTEGTYKVKLAFRSDYGTYTTSEGTVKVTGSIRAPTAQFNVVTPAPQAGAQTTFDASGSQGGSGVISAYQWSWGDGSEESIAASGSTTFTHTYSASGTYQVKLIVTNNLGHSSTAYSQSVVVAEASKEAPKEAPKETPKEAPKEALKETPPDRSVTNVSAHASELKAKGTVTLTLSCPATKVFCAGTATIESANAIAAKKKNTKRRKRVVLGQASFNVSGGQSQSLTLHLSASGAKLLSKLKRIPAVLVVSAHDSFGDQGTQSVPIALTPPAGGAKHKKHH
jgi:PKD repeat protein